MPRGQLRPAEHPARAACGRRQSPRGGYRLSRLRLVAVPVIVGGILLARPGVAQQDSSAPPAATQPAPEEIKQALETIKKGRTLPIAPAPGTDDSDGATLLRVDNPSPFPLIVLLVGPTTTRVELGPDRMQTLTIEPGDYEIAVTVTGRNLPPFYGRQTVVANMRYLHKFVLPTY